MIFIGIRGTGCDIELDIVRQTEKAFLLRTPIGREIWMPAMCIDGSGSLTTAGTKLYYEKINGRSK